MSQDINIKQLLDDINKSMQIVRNNMNKSTVTGTGATATKDQTTVITGKLRDGQIDPRDLVSHFRAAEANKQQAKSNGTPINKEAQNKLKAAEVELKQINDRLESDPIMPFFEKMQLVNRRSQLTASIPALRSSLWR